MKVEKLHLDESLADFTYVPKHKNTYDDDLYIDDVDALFAEGPAPGSDTGVAEMLMSAIKEEFTTIQTYNSMISTMLAENVSEYTSIIALIREIIVEENKHVGQLEEALKLISPNAENIDKGAEEGKSQLEFVGGKLQVQTWPTVNGTASASEASNTSVDPTMELCTLSDADDEF